MVARRHITEQAGEVHVGVHDVHLRVGLEQVVAHEDVVEGLRVAVEDERVRVPLVVARQRVVLGQQVRQDRLRTREDLGQIVGPLEGVEVAQHHDVGVGVLAEEDIDDLVEGTDLRFALGLAGLHERLRAAEDRRRPEARCQVVVDHRDLGVVEREHADERVASACECRRVARTEHAERCLRQRVVVDQVDPVGVVQEGVADVAAGDAAGRAVGRGDVEGRVGRAACGHDRIDERLERHVGRGRAVVGGAGVVLDLLECDDVGGVQVVDDLRRDLGPLRVVATEGVQVQHVVAGHRQPVVGRLQVRELLGRVGGTHREGFGCVDLVVAERVADHATNVAQAVADLDRYGGSEDRAVELDLDAFGVLVAPVVGIRLQQDAAAARECVVGFGELAARR